MNRYRKHLRKWLRETLSGPIDRESSSYYVGLLDAAITLNSLGFKNATGRPIGDVLLWKLNLIASLPERTKKDMSDYNMNEEAIACRKCLDASRSYGPDIECIKTAILRAREDMRENDVQAVKDEPEFPDSMPDEMYRAMKDACALRTSAEEFCRSIVKITKQCILERMSTLPVDGTKEVADETDNGCRDPARRA